MANGSGIDDVAAAYDQWSEDYDSVVNATRDLDATVLRRQDLGLAGADVIEVGCGSGKNTVFLAAHARSVLALDFSEGMLRKARARVADDRVRFVRHDVRERWPAPDASCDVVVADLVLEHVRHLEPFFAETARVLRPGGRLFTCELHPFRQLRGGQAQFVRGDTGEVQRVTAYRHDVSHYVNAGLTAGLQLVRVDDWRDEHAPDEAPRLFSTSWRR
jgi:ubiquinone/menaquinone biosynthesis C-methylase UbiE